MVYRNYPDFVFRRAGVSDKKFEIIIINHGESNPAMDMKPCVICKEPVDVDNCFGHIDDEDVYCEKHGNLGRIKKEFLDTENKIKVLQNDATKLQNQFNEEYAKIDGKTCPFVRYDIMLSGWVIEAMQRERKGKRSESTKLIIVTKKMSQNDFDNLCCQLGGSAPDAKIIFNIKVDKERLEKQKLEI